MRKSEKMSQLLWPAWSKTVINCQDSYFSLSHFVLQTMVDAGRFLFQYLESSQQVYTSKKQHNLVINHISSSKSHLV